MTDARTEIPPDLLFVYGHLRRQGKASRLTAPLAYLGAARTGPGYRLLACGEGDFPGLVPDPAAAGGIVGELVAVTDPRHWAVLDDYEDVAGGAYRREVIDLADGRHAQAYVYTAPDRDRLPDAGLDWHESPWRRP